ncbi:UvrD-helicase domain-containing protein [Erwinia sp. Leaf53]|uniref:UvrD-helicase domain-containing protein n=1 Tax=Erwinia sp. Leaf53 TaxID=1736225 RepID=UPI0006FD6D9E|nr:UvrD-helicase domain-containing protein [Erwinia sp. Leaf53]
MSFYLDNKQKEIEDNVTKEVRNLIRGNSSFYFIAGAGSGKTYALIDGVNEFIKLKHTELRAMGQTVLCITYTNNAANEIRKRVGDDNLTSISTIHSFIWETVNVHMDEMIEEHVIYLNEEITRINNDIYVYESDKKAIANIRDIGKDNISKVVEKIALKQNDFYDACNLGAKDFWDYLAREFGDEFSFKIKSNAQHVTHALKNLVRAKKYKICIDKILSKAEGFDSLKYFSSKNIESLNNNIIGHDTLLKYSSRMFCKYPALTRKVIDAHPIVFVDEFQDSEDSVLNIFLGLLEYSQGKKIDFCLGFFGDPVQAIYNNKMHAMNKKMAIVGKNINRRSHQTIVNCINKIRGSRDLIQQNPINIYSGKCDLSFEVRSKSEYSHSSIMLEIDKYKKKWGIDSNNKLTCLVLKNNMLSELCGFGDLFLLINDIYNIEFSKGFEKVSSEFLFSEERNAGRLPILLYEIILPLYLIKNKEELSLADVFGGNFHNSCSLNDLIESVRFFYDLGFITLYDYICDALDKKDECENLNNKSIKIIESVIPFDTQVIEHLISDIYNKCKFKKDEKTKKLIRKVLLTDIHQFYRWLDFLFQSISKNDTDYLTCHSSKGLEFDNVIVFLDDSFNRNETYISAFLQADINEILDDPLESARRIVYVSCSRAIKNLRVCLYTATGENIESTKGIFNSI